MSLIRICDGSTSKWDKEPFDCSAVVKSWFNTARDPNTSVYWAASERDEPEIVAAHTLTGIGSSGGLHIVRITLEDLAAVGSLHRVCAQRPGRTGIVHVDFLHRELLGAGEYVDALVLRIRDRYIAGEHRFRWIGSPVLRHQYSELLQLPDSRVICEAKRRCKRLLEGKAGPMPRPRSDEIKAQFQAAPPAIPHDIVCCRALRIYKETGRDDALANWYEAERIVRSDYEAKFTAYEPAAASAEHRSDTRAPTASSHVEPT